MTTSENAPTATRADLHCHSTASAVSKLGVSRALGLPECATPPEEVYALAKRRGMDFVTITDHDTIDGALAIADRPDVFVSEELTARFAGEPQAVHVLCLDITPGDHEWLQAHADDVEEVAEYLREQEIACALAHPFFAVAAPLTARHRRRLAELFDVWEVRNGARAPELNRARRDLRRHPRRRRHRRLRRPRGRRRRAHVDARRRPRRPRPSSSPTCARAASRRTARQGSAAKWAHAAMAIAVRVLGQGGDGAPPDPGVVLRMVERVMSEGDARAGAIGADLGPDDARALLRAWLAAIDLDLPDRELLALLQADGFSHSELYRRARRCHERKLQAAVGRVLEAADERRATATGPARPPRCSRPASPAIPYAPATAFLGREKRQARRPRRRPAAGRARRRRHRRDPRRDAHARGAARARRAGLRGRGDRHRRATSTAGCPRSPRSRCRLRRRSRSACRACRRSSTRSPRAATTCCTCARPGRPGSPRR